MNDRTTVPSTTRPTLSSRPSPSPTLTQALKGLSQGGATRSQILRGPVTDGFTDGAAQPDAAAAAAAADLSHPPREERERGRQMLRQEAGGLFKRDDNDHHIAVAEVHTDESLDRLVHTVHHHPQQRRKETLPPLSHGVPSRGIFSKTRGHYVYTDSGARMLPIAKPPDRFSDGSRMSDTSKEAKEERVEQSGRAGGVLNGGDKAAFTGGAAATAAAGEAAPLTKKQKVLRHYKKWWWLHLLVLIVVVILAVCLIIFVAIPRIAQARVNQATLLIQGISLTQTQSTNVTLAINSTIQADDSIHAVIDAFEGVMYLEDWAPQTPFARINFPSVTSAPESVVNITQFTPILDLNAFTVFNDWFIQNATIRVTVEGDSHLSVNAVNRKYPVHFKKTLEIPALSNLNGTTVPNSTILLTPDSQGDNFVGTAVIPNRSFISFELGNTSFINYMINANGTAENVGTIFIDNLTITPGNHSYPLRGIVSQTPVLQQIQQRPYCETGNIPFLLQGLNVTNHGQYLSYFAESLASTNQSVTIPIMADLQALGLTINCAD